MRRRPPISTLFPYTTLSRSVLRLGPHPAARRGRAGRGGSQLLLLPLPGRAVGQPEGAGRSEEHTSELQSRQYLVCRLLLEKKQKLHMHHMTSNTIHKQAALA